MSLTTVSWKDMMDEWHQTPDKLLAWLTKLFWDAEIDPESQAIWKAFNGLIEMGQSKSGHRVELRLCGKCLDILPWKGVTMVPEEECQCLCHKHADKEHCTQGNVE